MANTMQSGSRNPGDDLLIESVNSAAEFKDFCCGIDEMDEFIHNGLDLSVESCFCKLYKVSKDKEIVALLALSFDSLSLDPDDKSDLKSGGTMALNTSYKDTFWNKMHYPALEIAYLAVRKDYRGKSIGSTLIKEIFRKASEQDIAGCQFLTVEALNDSKEDGHQYSAVPFYSKNYFYSCEAPSSSKKTIRMFRPLYIRIDG